ncbi:MAG: ATP-dependent Clp protease ATP-binding subunit [Patescibacteria group bacterium]
MRAKINITPKGTLIGRAVVLDRYFSNFLLRLLFVLLWVLGLSSLFLLVVLRLSAYSTGMEIEFENEQRQTLSPNIISFFAGIFLLYLPLRAYYREKVKYPRPMAIKDAKSKVSAGQAINLFSVFSFELARATRSFWLKPDAAGNELARALLSSGDMNFILLRLGLSRSQVEASLVKTSGDTHAAEIIPLALDVAIAEGHHQIEVGDVFVALCQKEPSLQKIISDVGLEINDIANVVYWQTNLIRRRLAGRRFLDPGRFRLTGGIGRDWAFGYTPLLRRFGRDLTQQIRAVGLGLEVVGRDKEIDEIEEGLLRQNGGNVVLVGEAGAGKRTTVVGLAAAMADGRINDRLAFKRLIELDLSSLFAGYQGAGEANARLGALLAEVASAGNVIAFIPNIEVILSAEGVGRVDASDVLLSYLDSPFLHIIATADTAGYNHFIRPDTSLAEKLERVDVGEPDRNETIRILEDTVPLIEHESGSLISYEAIKRTVAAADKYIIDIPNPEKSINLLDGATARAAHARGKTIVTPRDIDDYLTQKHGVPAGEVGSGESRKLLHLEEEMHKSVIGQDEAIKAVAGALRRTRAGVVESKKPIGSFLFLGPTGVGKTETAKALARAYFGGEERMVRFDMSEYQNKTDIYRLIGSELGEEESQGTLATAVREQPFCLLLFDEVEKAHPDILDLFLQVLDEGRLTDGAGRRVVFSNTIIICTSNAGANLIRESAGGILSGVLIDYVQKEEIFRPEFVNRFTAVVAFSPLSSTEISRIASLMIAKLAATVDKNRGVRLTVSPEAAARLVQLGYDPKMGARPLARIISEKVENLLAENLLAGKLKKGDSFTVTAEMVI